MAQKRNRNPYALNSSDYWRSREEDNRIKAQMDDYTRSLEIRGIYQDMYKRADTNIQAYYQKYADENGISYADAMQKVSKLDIEAYEAKAKRYVADKDFSAEANAEMRLYNMTMKVNRLEMLKADIGLELVDGFYGMDKYFDAELRGEAYAEHQRLAGILGETINGNAKNATVLPDSSHRNIGFTVREVEGVAVEPFYHATFSNRIWTHYTELKNELDILLARALVNGESVQRLSAELRDKFDVSQDNAMRLMVTESARVRIDVQKKFYEANGNDRYEVLALGQKPCRACLELAERSQKEKGLPVKDMKPGVTAPPMHPWCHCSTAPYVDMDDYEKWLNALDSGLTTDQYNALTDSEKEQFAPKRKTVSIKKKKPWTRAMANYTSRGAKDLRVRLDRAGVEYHMAEELPTKLTSAQIVERIAGGDKTKGSCFSQACTYIANRAGLDVHDYRGGASQSLFSTYYDNFTEFEGVVCHREEKGGLRPAKKLLALVEEGKEYLFTTGRHSAMVRKVNGELQYLELQSPKKNGWRRFEFKGRTKVETTDANGFPAVVYEDYERTLTDTLRDRFCCKGYTVDHSHLIEAESLYNSSEFRDLIGYINTPVDEQLKGVTGSVK